MSDSKEIYKTGCPKCDSSDGFAVYDDGHGYCFVCQHYEHDVEKKDDMESRVYTSTDFEQSDGLSRAAGLVSSAHKSRGISREVAEHFGVLSEYSSDGSASAVLYPYTKDGDIVAYKVRELPKQFSTIGNFKGTELFGQSVFPRGGRRVVVVEGEYDALAVAEAYRAKGTIYPVVSLPSASGTKALVGSRDYLRSFDEVILLLDNDEAGRKAKEEAAKLIGYDKVKIGDLGKCKDPNELLLEDPYKVLQAIWNAQAYTPAGIVAGEDIWKQLEKYDEIESIPYPECLGGLNDKLRGMRRGEITLWTSGTGSGKSTILREIALHLHQTTQDKIGIVALEESPAETARKLSGMVLNRNPAKEEIPLGELRQGFDRVFSDGRISVLDHNGSVSANVIELIEFLCASGCTYIFLDHITILVSEGADGLSGNEAIDKIMNDLRAICKKWNVWIGLVSHLRKMGDAGKSFEDGKIASLDDIRGSGSIKQVSYDIIAFARDVGNENEKERNTIQMKVLKSRYTGLTGPAGAVHYDYDTGRLKKATFDGEDEFDYA